MPSSLAIHSFPRLLPALLLLSACTVTGPADDGWENYNEWVDNGRLLSDEARTVYRSSDARNKKETASQETELDFDAYQQWRHARETDSAEYRKFRLWQEFEAFERWKEEQRAD